MPFREMMCCSARNGIVRATPPYIGQKFGYYKAFGGLAYVLAERPPAEIVGFFELFVRAVEQRNISADKFPCPIIWVIIFVELAVRRVKRVEVMLVVVAYDWRAVTTRLE